MRRGSDATAEQQEGGQSRDQAGGVHGEVRAVRSEKKSAAGSSRFWAKAARTAIILIKARGKSFKSVMERKGSCQVLGVILLSVLGLACVEVSTPATAMNALFAPPKGHTKDIVTPDAGKQHLRPAGWTGRAVLCLVCLFLSQAGSIRAASLHDFPINTGATASLSASPFKAGELKTARSVEPVSLESNGQEKNANDTQAPTLERPQGWKLLEMDSVAMLTGTCLLLLGMMVFGTRLLPAGVRALANWSASHTAAAD